MTWRTGFRPLITWPGRATHESPSPQRWPLVVSLADGKLTLSANPESATGTIRVCVGDEVRDLRAGEQCVFDVGRPDPA